MQYRNHPITGEPLLDEKAIESCLSHKTIKQWAWIEHDADVYSEEDELDGRGYGEIKAGDFKPPHFHIVMRTETAIEPDKIAQWLGIPAQYVDVPKGRGAFLDCVEYLTHESQKQQDLGKTLYPDEAVHASWDFRKDLIKRAAMKAIHGGLELSKRDVQRYDVLKNGKTLDQCYNEDPILYMADLDKLKKLRLEYLARMDLPTTRQNFYVCGEGGVGKDTASRALARCLFPGLKDEECFFIVGGDSVTFDGYDGQPVIIWSDIRASDLLAKLGRRGNVFAVFDTNPTRQKQSIKYGSVSLVNYVNIVNSVQPWEEFLNELSQGFGAMEYEDRNQSYRRFPFIFPLREYDFDFLINLGYMCDTNQYQEYLEYRNIRGSFARVARKLGDTELAREIESRMLEQPMNKLLEIKARKEIAEGSSVDFEEFSDYGSIGEVINGGEVVIGSQEIIDIEVGE